MTITSTTRLGLPQWSADTDAAITRVQTNAAFAELENVVAIDGQGTSTAFSAISPGVRGRYYYVTTTGTLWRDDGTQWDAINPATSYNTPGSSSPGDSAAQGSALTVARSDHRHAREAFGIASDIASMSPASGGASAGSSGSVPRADHRHALPSWGASIEVQPIVFNGSLSNGGIEKFARVDHQHPGPADPTGKGLARSGHTASFYLNAYNGSGPPGAGSYSLGDLFTDTTGVVWVCTTGGDFSGTPPTFRHADGIGVNRLAAAWNWNSTSGIAATVMPPSTWVVVEMGNSNNVGDNAVDPTTAPGSAPGYTVVHWDGIYIATCNFTWPNYASGARYMRCVVNGVVQRGRVSGQSGTNGACAIGMVKMLYLNAGDQVSFQVFQDSGATLASYLPVNPDGSGADQLNTRDLLFVSHT